MDYDEMQSYEGSLKMAGAEVHAFQEFGDYQGTWWAKVTYKGKTGWISGSYGSCSGCDAFQAEFDYGQGHPSELAKFGEGYLDPIMTQEEALKEASENLSWDHEAEEVVKFINDFEHDQIMDEISDKWGDSST